MLGPPLPLVGGRQSGSRGDGNLARVKKTRKKEKAGITSSITGRFGQVKPGQISHLLLRSSPYNAQFREVFFKIISELQKSTDQLCSSFYPFLPIYSISLLVKLAQAKDSETAKIHAIV